MSTTPKAGYVVTAKGKLPKTFSCLECEGGGYGCECFIDALVFGRSSPRRARPSQRLGSLALQSPTRRPLT